MLRVLLNFILLFLSIGFFYKGYLCIIGKAKYWRCISDCYTAFNRWSCGLWMLGWGGLILFFLKLNLSKSKKPIKLIKKGKYCYINSVSEEPYCCKCAKEGRYSKLILLEGKYMCPRCDYTVIYFYNTGKEIDMEELKKKLNDLH